MAAPNQKLKNFVAFVDGRGLAGQVSEFTPPVLTLKTEEIRAGGMDAPEEVVMGMEALTCEFIMESYNPDVLSLFGMVEGGVVPVTLRGALEDVDGSVEAIEYNMRGKIKSIDPGTWKPGENTQITVGMSLTYFRHRQAGRVITEIDVPGMVRIVGGTDQLANQRRALGI